MKVIALSLNPVYDLFYTINDFKLYKENFVTSSYRSSAGKGINVSRALCKAGVGNKLYIVFGEENSAEYVKQITDEGICFKPYYTEGRIRENITVFTPGAAETRICFDTFSIKPETLNEIYDDIKTEADGETVIVCSGKMPCGITKQEVLSFLLRLKKICPRLAVDSNSLTLDDHITVRPWLIKPNEQEAQTYSDVEVKTTADAKNAACILRDKGIDNVIISFGGSGAVYAGEKGVYISTVPKITPVSTIGAGDSTVAGFIAAYLDGADGAQCLRNACAFGTAACLRNATEAPEMSEIENIKKDINVIEA